MRTEASAHSRAARRAASPSLDLDKSITSLKAPAESPKALGVQNAGISKKQNAGKRMTRAQRMRHEKGVERADRNFDVHETKVIKSAARGKRVKERAVCFVGLIFPSIQLTHMQSDWQDLNKKLETLVQTNISNPFDAIQGGNDDDDDDDDESDMNDDDNDNAPAELQAVNKQTIFSAQNLSHFETAPDPSVDEHIDGIL